MTSWSSDRHHYLGSFNKGFPSMWCWRHRVYSVNTNICITFAQRRPNVFDVGPTLCKFYTNCLLGIWLHASIKSPSLLAPCWRHVWRGAYRFSPIEWQNCILTCHGMCLLLNHAVCVGGGGGGEAGRAQPLVGIETGHDTGPLRADID